MRWLPILALVACSEQPDDTGSDRAWDARFDPLAQALQDELAASGATAVSFAVLEQGEITFAQAFGSKHPDDDIPVTPDTLFQIGSLTKQMTAAAVLQKVEDGALSLDDTLAETVPQLTFARDPSWSAQITLHDQLTHQTGLYDRIPWEQTGSDDATLDSFTTSEFAAEEYQMNPAGRFFNYSNPNFVLAALAIEGVDERAWPDVVEQDLFAPLGMERTFARKAPVVADGDYAIGKGYLVSPSGNFLPGTVEIDDVSDYAWLRPVALVWSTPTDLLTWCDFLMHGDPAVLSDALRTEITTAHVSQEYGYGAAEGGYGYGITVMPGLFLRDLDHFYAVPMWDHPGNTLSYTAHVYLFPDRDVAFVYLASGYQVEFRLSVRAAIETVVDLPAAVDPPPAYSWDPDRLDDHVGTYHDPHLAGELVVTREGDALKISTPDLDHDGNDVTPELESVTDTTFVMYVDGFPYDLTFIGEPGQPSEYVRNRGFVFIRDAAPVAR